MWKQGDIVICVDYDVDELTINKNYTVICHYLINGYEYVKVENDEGNAINYFKYHFKLDLMRLRKDKIDRIRTKIYESK